MTVSTPLMSSPREATSVARRWVTVEERNDSMLEIRCGEVELRDMQKQMRGEEERRGDERGGRPYLLLGHAAVQLGGFEAA